MLYFLKILLEITYRSNKIILRTYFMIINEASEQELTVNYLFYVSRYQ